MNRLRGVGVIAALAAVVLLGAGPVRATSYSWGDVQPGSRAWFAKAAIDDVAGAHYWMRDFGPHAFHPIQAESRQLWARAVVRAFAPSQKPKHGLVFNDLPATSPFYPFANVAVVNGWMTTTNGNFSPNAPVKEFGVSNALVRALGLMADVNGANAIHMDDGRTLAHSPEFGVLLIGRVIGLWYNHDSRVAGDGEAYDLLPTTPVPRDDAAYALHTAASLGSSAHWSADQYANIDVGEPGRAARKVIRFGMKFVGYPYVYAGEWDRPTTSPPYCCGTQLQGGFDCSGFTWWLVRAGDNLWNNTKIRGYVGWILPQRSSEDMAAAITVKQRIPFSNLRPADVMLYGSSPNPANIYHADVYIGNGWALDSGDNGVSIVYAAGSWYRQTFQYGRRLRPAS